MRILVTGSRTWEDRALIKEFFGSLFDVIGQEGHTLVSGGCPTGADAISEELLSQDLVIERHEAQWGMYGLSAGPRRNKDMVNSSIDFAVAFVRGGSQSKGTTGTLALLNDRRVPHVRIDHGFPKDRALFYSLINKALGH